MIKKVKDFMLRNKVLSVNELMDYYITPVVMVILGFCLMVSNEYTAGTVWIVGYFVYSRINKLGRLGY